MRQTIRVGVCAGLALAVMLAGTSFAVAQEKKIALVVGVEHYNPDAFKPLTFAEDDALELEKVLTGLGFDVISMTSQSTIPARKPNTPTKIADQLERRLKNREHDDTVLVFLSGHGIQLKSDPIAEDGSRETYFCPEEADPGDKSTLLPLSRVMESLSKCEAGRKVLLVDACRDEVTPKNGKKGHEELQPVQIDRPPVPKGMIALFSCSPKETSYEFPELGHAVFTHYLLDYLKGSAVGARYPKQELRVTELAAYVTRETGDYLDRKLGKTQSPQLIAPGVSDWPLGKLDKRPDPPPLLVAPFTAADAKRAQEGWAAAKGVSPTRKHAAGGQLTLVPAGEFDMGNEDTVDELLRQFPDSKKEWFEDAAKRHRVRITKPYWLGTHEVTIGEFRKFVDETGHKTEAERDDKGGWGYDGESGFKQDPKFTWRNAGFEPAATDEHPVVNVTWNDAAAFCNWLGGREGKPPYYRIEIQDGKTEVTNLGGAGYRLPTEAEWEYACRAGTTTRYQGGNDPESLVTVGNVGDATGKGKFSFFKGTVSANDGYVFTAPKGRFLANRFGLYDMHGNVLEWCHDWYDAEFYRTSRRDDPSGVLSGSYRVFRGGGWGDSAEGCLSASRYWFVPSDRNFNLGFRLALSPSGE
jgi:formylglycine-generating enzyme